VASFFVLDSVGVESFPPGVTFDHCPQVFDSVWLIATGRMPRTQLHLTVISLLY
jgi:hypothetical protein